MDDPEGIKIYSKMLKKSAQLLPKKEAIFIRVDNQIMINVLQRIASVVIQKSIREGFCLVVTEALLKATPVVTSNIGGITLQIDDGKNGFHVESLDNEAFAYRIINILSDPELAQKSDKEAQQTVKEKFLITKHLLEYSDLFNEIIKLTRHDVIS